MMTWSNSKPRVVGLPFPNLTAECIFTAHPQPENKFHAAGALFPHPTNASTSAKRDTEASLSAIILVPQTYARYSKHIAPRLSTRLSPIRF